ncbi:MAG: GrpB family protein [Bacillota bacterium]
MRVLVNKYDPNWTKMYEKEANLIRDIFKDKLLEIHHIGSTSVKGLKAKPIIDIMPLVEDIKKVDKHNDEMIKIGYEPMGEYGISKRRYFRKGKDGRYHHVHVFEIDSEHANRHLAFRDYLREHKEIAKKYGNLKEKLAQKYPNDIESYMDGKNDFIKKHEKFALKWYENNSK